MPGEKRKNLHPEQQNDEFFLWNMTEDEWPMCQWETKRKGRIAYDRKGRIIKGMFPVFIKETEARERTWGPKDFPGPFDENILPEA